jgi:holin-like protein
MAGKEAPPLDIAGAVLVLLACQLAGETAVQAMRLGFPGFAFPGPVIGMALLLGILIWRGGPGPSLDAASGAILRNLSLLFVPAAVGIVQYGSILAEFGIALVAALVLSTVLTLLVTVGVFIAVSRRMGARDGA